MKKCWAPIALLVCLAFVWSACGKANNTPTPGVSPAPIPGVQATPSLPTPTPVPQETPSSPSPTPGLPDPELLEGEYVLTESIVVGHGRALILKLYGKKQPDIEMYGIRVIDVLDGNTRLQTIFIHDAILQEWGGDDHFGGYTESWGRDGGFTAQDMNFDGSQDIGLVGWSGYGPNVSHYYWLWNEAEQRFLYAFSLISVEVDLENQQLISHTRSSFNQYATDYYRYDEDGQLQNVKRIIDIMDDDGSVTTETYELIDGELQLVE